jgi:hypothetical protein
MSAQIWTTETLAVAVVELAVAKASFPVELVAL